MNQAQQKINISQEHDFNRSEARAGSSSVLGGSSLLLKTSYLKPHAVEVTAPQVEFVLKEGFPDHPHKLVKRMLGKIAVCRRGNWVQIMCSHCKNPVMIGKKYLMVKRHCNNKFCSCEECIEQRRLKAWTKLKNYGIEKDELVHMEISFPLQLNESDDKRRKRELTLRYIRESFRKLDLYWFSLTAWDIKATIVKELKSYFMHYHIALLPKNYRKFMAALPLVREKVMKKSSQEFTIHNEGWKPKVPLLGYFAKIMAGKLSDDKHHHAILYRDMMSPEEYHRLFYRKRILRLSSPFGLLSLRKAERSEALLMFKGLCFKLPGKCSFCSHKLDLDSIYVIKIREDFKPPDKSRVLIDYNVTELSPDRRGTLVSRIPEQRVMGKSSLFYADDEPMPENPERISRLNRSGRCLQG